MKIALVVIAALAALEMTAAADPTAEDHFNAGQEAYARGDFSTAIGEWQASYMLSGENDLLFNLAQAMRLSGDCAGALSTYRKYSAGDPAASEQHKLAEDFARDLEAKCGAKQVQVVDPPRPAPQPTPTPVAGLNDREDRATHPDRTLKIAGLATGGAGVAVLATGLILGRHASSIGDEVTSACRTTCDWATWKDKDAAGRRDAAIGRALDVAGVVGIAGGAVLYYFGIRQGAITVSPRSHEDGVVVTWSGSW
jgi:hypothetical protein